MLFRKGDPYGKRFHVWEGIYRDYFGLDPDFSGLAVPNCPNDGVSRWLVVVHEAIDTERAFKVCQERFGARNHSGHSLADDMIECRIFGKGPYAVWVAASANPKRLFEEVSGEFLVGDRHDGMTLRERLLLEILYDRKRGQHPDRYPHERLDETRATICLGNRFMDGSYPIVHSIGEAMTVNRCPREDICLEALDWRSVAA